MWSTSPPRQCVWSALLEGRFTREYWGYENISDWKAGSSWEHLAHDQFEQVPEMLPKISAGWPRILSSLKSFLETGRTLPTWAQH